jgi:transcriptional regulator with XRE-family HTH domain
MIDPGIANIRRQVSRRLEELIDKTYGARGAAQFAKDMNIPDQTMRPWLAGESLPSSDKLIKISKKTGRSIDWLLLGKEGEILSSDERHLLRQYRILRSDEETKELIFQIMELAMDAGRGKRKGKGVVRDSEEEETGENNP